MSTIKSISVIIGMVVLGAVGALIFNVSLFPYFLASTYFENFQFVKDFKQGKIVVNKSNQTYIQENTAIEDAVGRVENSVVAIQSPTLGVVSGLVVTSDGSVVTLAQGIPARGTITVFLQGQKQTASVVKIDAKNNLALLKISDSNLQTVGFSDANNIKIGQKVFLVAPTSTAQDNWFANEGIIREITADTITTTMVEKPVAIGGPLFDAAGELVGLNVIDANGNVSAIPVNKIQALLGL